MSTIPVARVIALGARAFPAPLRILAYHGVDDADAFARQVDHVVKYYVPVDAQAVVDAMAGTRDLPPGAVWFTFDDGRRSVVTEGLPILEHAAIRPTLFVCPGLIETGEAAWWDVVDRAAELGLVAASLGEPTTSARLKQVPDAVRRQGVAELASLLRDRGVSIDHGQLTDDDLRTWTEAGGDLGNHSWDHPCLNRCDAAAQREQLERTDAWLRARGVDRPRVFAYPNGDATEATEHVLRALGYDVGLLFDHRLASPDQPRYRLSRLRISSTASIERFAAIVSGWHSVGYRVKQRVAPGTVAPPVAARSSGPVDESRAIYERTDVVAEYASLEGLKPCERLLFDTYVFDGAAVLDLGVGAGRTIPYLAARAGLYVAVDYSAAMVEAARQRHEGVDVRQLDAADLGDFDDASFDVVVFSYNGLDHLQPRQRRGACLDEIARVTKPGGIVIASSHNARAVARPRATDSHGIRSRAVQAYATARLWRASVPTSAFWHGEGYLRDSASPHTTFATTPALMARDAARHGLEVLEVVGSRYPEVLPRWQEPWLYYALRRTA